MARDHSPWGHIAAVAADEIAIVGIVQVTQHSGNLAPIGMARPLPKASPKILTTAF
jgi:hypothetical protein